MTRITEEEYRAILAGSSGDRLGIPPKKSKYKNDKITYQGETFDSKKEFEYYLILEDRVKRGEILSLQRQVSFIIQPEFKINGKTIRAITYKADFVYKDLKDGAVHIIDVKGYKTEVYKLKKKLLAYRGIFIEEV